MQERRKGLINVLLRCLIVLGIILHEKGKILERDVITRAPVRLALQLRRVLPAGESILVDLDLDLGEGVG